MRQINLVEGKVVAPEGMNLWLCTSNMKLLMSWKKLI